MNLLLFGHLDAELNDIAAVQFVRLTFLIRRREADVVYEGAIGAARVSQEKLKIKKINLKII